MRFFVPQVADDAQAELEWARYVRACHGPTTSRRVYRIAYEHERSQFEVRVGESRSEHRRQTGPRGGYRRNAGYDKYGRATGTVVTAIVDVGHLIYVFSDGPPYGGWGNPSLVDPDSITEIEYFEDMGRP